MKKNKKKLFVLFLVLYLISIPFLVYAISNWSWMDLSGKSNIGDALGGITNPIIGVGGIILTFLAFYIQYKFNLEQSELIKLQRDERIEEKNEIEILKRNNYLESELVKFEDTIFELSKEYHEIRGLDLDINATKRVKSLIKRFIYLYMSINVLSADFIKKINLPTSYAFTEQEFIVMNKLVFLNKVYLESELNDFFEIINNLILKTFFESNDGFYHILKMEVENNSNSMMLINDILTKINNNR